MSALAHASTHHANVASVQLNSEPAVTSISVSARIDYIQRFSKQAVLVIDDDVDVYTQASRQFLISLSKENTDHETNVAFVSASTKLNDIQMRCRLIEQLFSSTLFDPEKSLAVSMLQLSKQNKESIMIVVEHAHALSLQLKYELCQLVDVANKTHNKINVVLFAQEQAAQEIAINKTIFNNKLAIIDAKSGQIFALDNPKFKKERVFFTDKFWKNSIIAMVTICTIIGISWFVLIESDSFTLAKLPLSNDVALESTATTAATAAKSMPVATDTIAQANAKDIYTALQGDVVLTKSSEDKPALATDILHALDLNNTIESQPVIKAPELPAPALSASQTILSKPVMSETSSSEKVSKAAEITGVNAKLPIQLTPNYYLHASTGYVIQIVGFSDMTLLTRFVEQYPELEYFSYQKILNEKPLVVLTTQIFDSKEQARTELQLLPQTIKEKGVWVKALSTIKTEINTVRN